MQPEQTQIAITPMHKRAFNYSTATWLSVIIISFIIYPLTSYIYNYNDYIRDSVKHIIDNHIIMSIFKNSILSAHLTDADMNMVLLAISIIAVTDVVAFTITMVYMVRFYRHLHIGTFGHALTM